MGGQSESKQTSQSTTEPWSASQPFLYGLLNQLGSKVTPSGGLSENEATALSSIEGNAQQGNPYSGLLDSLATTLLNGGGATAQSGNINDTLNTYRGQLTPYANGSMVGKNPALQGQLDVLSNDIQGRVNGMFAGAGRDLSGANVQQVARGIAEGTAPVIANQYNADVANQLNAAGSLYGAGNTTAGLLTGLNQQDLANRQTGADVATTALDAKNYGPLLMLQAEAQRRGIPLQALGLLANIGIPLGGLGQQNQGTATGTSRMSGAQQFATIASGINALMPKNPIKFG